MLSNDQLKALQTPAYIYSEAELHWRAGRASEVIVAADAQLFFPLKCHNVIRPLQIIAQYVGGFAASSLFEARLAREVLGDEKRVHFTSPCLRNDELEVLLSLCDGISFNSLSQWAQFKKEAIGRVTCGLRVNPQLSFVKDDRYNPCGPYSRLGAPLEQIKQLLCSEPKALAGIEGVHFHTNCDATDWSPLLRIVRHLDAHIPGLLEQCRWINLGGGYLLDDSTDLSAFREAVQFLQKKYGLEVIIEPGASIVRDTCILVAQVVDLFVSDGKQVAVLDTTVNHMPEVFEYQFSPDVVGDTNGGCYCYILAGATCLAGDVFGGYAIEAPLAVGSRMTFANVGAYTLVKSHMFNGVNLPTIYSLGALGELTLQKQFKYEDFIQRWGTEKHDQGLRNVIAYPEDSGQRRPTRKICQ